MPKNKRAVWDGPVGKGVCSSSPVWWVNPVQPGGGVVKLANTGDLASPGDNHLAGSSPATPTNFLSDQPWDSLSIKFINQASKLLGFVKYSIAIGGKGLTIKPGILYIPAKKKNHNTGDS